ncbi:hypothetical protein GCM10012280_57770 [Wenjunlia tyrosinilytica]|uniref:DUF397 domain-containing protein n=2 Tax=Wenjunlia tyrosinilytica TaxID=1544741 RepID=A0A918E1R5_9ACTN|nr:hypothetical protein GCM10012280_57770 [Wenjunlia tyrosinilytica]
MQEEMYVADSTTERLVADGKAAKKPQLDLTDAEWLSSTQGVGDVQIAFVEGYIAMRDGRNPDGPALIFTPGEWRAFVLGARDGEFDLT